MNALVPQTGSTALAMPPGYDPYAAYGEATSSDANKLFIGFKNGEYFYGQDKDEIPLGTKLIANMAGLRIGFRRWENQRPVEEVMGLLLDGFRLPARAELGFLDKSTWEIQDDGTPRDPWQLTNELSFRGLNSEDKFVYSASSKSAIGAIGALCKAYGELYRQKPGQAPVVELGRDSYVHKKHGKTYVPQFKLVSWIKEPVAAAPVDDDAIEDAPPPPPPPVVEKAKKRTQF